MVDAECGEEGSLALGPDRVDVFDALALGIDDHPPWPRPAGLAQDLDQGVTDRADVGGVALLGDVDRSQPLRDLGHHRRNVAVLGRTAGSAGPVVCAKCSVPWVNAPGTTMTVSMPNGVTSKPIDSAKASPAALLAM